MDVREINEDKEMRCECKQDDEKLIVFKSNQPGIAIPVHHLFTRNSDNISLQLRNTATD